MREKVTYGINPSFDRLFHTLGQVAHVLRTRSPLSTNPKTCFSFDLHVLTMPPAFTLSQDQTLQKRVVQMHAQAWVIADSVFKKIWLVTRLYRSHKITFKEQPRKWGKESQQIEGPTMRQVISFYFIKKLLKGHEKASNWTSMLSIRIDSAYSFTRPSI